MMFLAFYHNPAWILNLLGIIFKDVKHKDCPEIFHSPHTA